MIYGKFLKSVIIKIFLFFVSEFEYETMNEILCHMCLTEIPKYKNLIFSEKSHINRNNLLNKKILFFLFHNEI